MSCSHFLCVAIRLYFLPSCSCWRSLAGPVGPIGNIASLPRNGVRPWPRRRAKRPCRACSSPIPATPQFTTPLDGKPAPAFTLPDLSGKKISLANYRGKALLINFWATWCGPCKLETPWLVDLRNKYAAQGFEVLGIDTEGDDAKPGDAAWSHDKTEIEKFVQQEKMPYPVLVDGDSISKPYGGLDDLPTSFFVDRNGKIVAAQVGINSESDIENNIKKALAE